MGQRPVGLREQLIRSLAVPRQPHRVGWTRLCRVIHFLRKTVECLENIFLLFSKFSGNSENTSHFPACQKLFYFYQNIHTSSLPSSLPSFPDLFVPSFPFSFLILRNGSSVSVFQGLERFLAVSFGDYQEAWEIGRTKKTIWRLLEGMGLKSHESMDMSEKG